jgi:aspartate/methionine/tyrosine aminotransferase
VRRTLTTTGIEVSPENVMILPGGKPTMYAAIIMFGEPGAEILYPDPGFPIYRSMIEFTGPNQSRCRSVRRTVLPFRQKRRCR